MLAVVTALSALPVSGVAFAGTPASATTGYARLATGPLTDTHPAYSGTYTGTSQAACTLARNSNVPDEAFTVYNYLLAHNYSPPKGLSGNSVYSNSTHKLPNPPSGYRWFEYNVYAGSGTAQRIVTARNFESTGGGYPYYTPDHYDTFEPMYYCLEAS
jgi:guanyl-specific ribonuclease Sa